MGSPDQPVIPPPPAIAIIDGALCQLTRRGTCAASHPPLATAVVEFLPGPQRYYVREHPFGLLPGIPNLYCVDAGLRLLWMAAWPHADDPCTGLVGERDGALLAQSARGMLVRIDAADGRFLGEQSAMAVTA